MREFLKRRFLRFLRFLREQGVQEYRGTGRLLPRGTAI